MYNCTSFYLLYRKNNYFFTHTNKIGRSPNALSNRDQLELIYYWCKETPLTTISHITGRHLCTVKRWVNKCQEIPLQKFKKRRKLGGFGKNIYIHCYSFKHLQVKGKNNIIWCILYYFIILIKL